MAEEHRLVRQMETGARAAREYEETEAAFDRLDADYIAKLRASPDPVARERHWVALQVLGEVKRDLMHRIAAGRAAQIQLEQLEAVNGDTRKADGVV